MKTLRDLRVWRESIDFAVAIYSLCERFPTYERYGLSAQLRRAAVSAASNIAEGQGRLTLGEWRQFLGHARGSLYEIETQLEIAARLAFVEDEVFRRLSDDLTELRRGLHQLIRYVEGRMEEKNATRNPQPAT